MAGNDDIKVSQLVYQLESHLEYRRADCSFLYEPNDDVYTRNYVTASSVLRGYTVVS